MKFPAQIQLFSRVSFLEKLLFTKHLAIIIKAGITITEALEILIAQTKSPPFKKILSAVLADIENGQTLTKSLSQHSQVFDQFYLGLIEVGEESGTLEENLEFLAKQLAKDYALQRKIQASMLYPGLVFTAALVMGSFIALFVLPKLVVFFEAFETNLPLTTQVLLFLAKTTKNYGLFIALGFLVMGLVSYAVLQLKFVKPKWHRLILKLPLVGKMLTYAQLARFNFNLGILLKSGVPIAKSLEITSRTLSNLKFKADLLEVSQSLAKGKNIGETLVQKEFPEFPLLVAKMISVGEKTGKLEEVLLYLGDFFEEEIDNLAKNLTTILEPILLIAVGLVVGFVALAIISPIYELTGSIHR